MQKPQFADAWKYRHDRIEFVKRIVDNVGGKYATDPNYVTTMNAMFKTVISELSKFADDELKALNKPV